MALKKIHTFYDFSRLQLYFPDFVQVWEIALQFQDFFNNSRLCTSPVSRALDNLRWRVLLADTKLNRNWVKISSRKLSHNAIRDNTTKYLPLWGCAGDRVGMVVKLHCGTVLGDEFSTWRQIRPRTQSHNAL